MHLRGRLSLTVFRPSGLVMALRASILTPAHSSCSRRQGMPLLGVALLQIVCEDSATAMADEGVPDRYHHIEPLMSLAERWGPSKGLQEVDKKDGIGCCV